METEAFPSSVFSKKLWSASLITAKQVIMNVDFLEGGPGIFRGTLLPIDRGAFCFPFVDDATRVSHAPTARVSRPIIALRSVFSSETGPPRVAFPPKITRPGRLPRPGRGSAVQRELPLRHLCHFQLSTRRVK